jgi:hypothetical protein
MHGFQEKPKPVCPKCGSPDTFKMVSACGIIIHSTRAKRFVLDACKKESDCREALRRDYGIHSVTPRAGVTMNQVYSEIKKQGTFTRDKMQAKKEIDDIALRAKQKAWKIAALRRTPERAKIRAEKKAQEEHKKRAIKI